MALDKLYNTKEAAAALGVSVRTLFRLINGEGGRAKLPAQKVGNTWKIKEKDIEAYLVAGQITDEPENS